MEEARLVEQAWNAQQAVNGPEHTADVALRNKLSGELQEVHDRVNKRLDNYSRAMNALRDYHQIEVESGEAEPADNEDAAQVINGYGHTYDSDEWKYVGPKTSITMTNGVVGFAHDDDIFEDFTPPARAD
jgi:hypothetical protein